MRAVVVAGVALELRPCGGESGDALDAGFEGGRGRDTKGEGWGARVMDGRGWLKGAGGVPVVVGGGVGGSVLCLCRGGGSG